MNLHEFTLSLSWAAIFVGIFLPSLDGLLTLGLPQPQLIHSLMKAPMFLSQGSEGRFCVFEIMGYKGVNRSTLMPFSHCRVLYIYIYIVA